METNGISTDPRPDGTVSDRPEKDGQRVGAASAPDDLASAPDDLGTDSSLQAELDRLSLTQSLVDTEIAVARVIDLTERLVDARHQLTATRADLEQLRLEHARYRAEQELILASRAVRLARRLSMIKKAIRG